MIPTWLHGCIDYGVSGVYAAASRSDRLSPPVRQALGTAALYHTSYSLVTDYEAGVRPWLSMRQHLALDSLGAAALCAVGLAWRGAPDRDRALLLAAGLAELAIIHATQDSRASTQGSRTSTDLSSAGSPASASNRKVPVIYPPLDTPKPVADNVFIVDSTLPGLLGKVLPVRMTVLRLADGTLLLHSPTRFTPALRDALLQLGPITHLVAPNSAHWTLLKPWQEAFPQARTWAAPGLPQRRQVRRSGLRFDAELSNRPPPDWGGTIKLGVVPGGFGFHEVMFLHRPSATLVLTDLVVNLEPRKTPGLFRPVLRLFGSEAPDGMPPPYLRAVVRMRQRQAALAVRRMLDQRPERVIFTHGRWFDHDATEALRRSWRWLLPEAAT